jgi:hypothetical protein
MPACGEASWPGSIPCNATTSFAMLAGGLPHPQPLEIHMTTLHPGVRGVNARQAVPRNKG